MSENVIELFTEAEVSARIDELAADIARTVPADVTVVGLLKGAFMVTTDLVRALDRHGLHPSVEFIQVSSYGLEQESSGAVKVIGGMPGSVQGRDVLIVDDIQDTARTLKFTVDLMKEQGANRVWTCVLLDKPDRRVIDFEADWIGFQIPDVFVVGYGIDYAERWRHLPYVGRVDSD